MASGLDGCNLIREALSRNGGTSPQSYKTCDAAIKIQRRKPIALEQIERIKD